MAETHGRSRPKANMKAKSTVRLMFWPVISISAGTGARAARVLLASALLWSCSLAAQVAQPNDSQPASPPPGSWSLAKCCLGQWLPQYSSRNVNPGGMASAKSTLTAWISRGSSHMMPWPSWSGRPNGAASKGVGDSWPRSGQARANAARSASQELGFTA